MIFKKLGILSALSFALVGCGQETNTEDTQVADTGIVDPCEGVEPSLFAQPNCGVAPLTVDFDGTGLTDFETWGTSWVFGDDSPDSPDLVTSHTYETPGEYEAEVSMSWRENDMDMEMTLFVNIWVH